MQMHTPHPPKPHTMLSVTQRSLVAVFLWVWLTSVDDDFEIEFLLPLWTAYAAWSEVLLRPGNRRRVTAAAPRSFWSFRAKTEGHSFTGCEAGGQPRRRQMRAGDAARGPPAAAVAASGRLALRQPRPRP